MLRKYLNWALKLTQGKWQRWNFPRWQAVLLKTAFWPPATSFFCPWVSSGLVDKPQAVMLQTRGTSSVKWAGLRRRSLQCCPRPSHLWGLRNMQIQRSREGKAPSRPVWGKQPAFFVPFLFFSFLFLPWKGHWKKIHGCFRPVPCGPFHWENVSGNKTETQQQNRASPSVPFTKILCHF